MATRKSSRVKTPRERLGQALGEHVVADFSAFGSEVVAKLRQEKPLDYLKLIQAILDKEDAGGAVPDAGYNVIERRIIEAGPRHG